MNADSRYMERSLIEVTSLSRPDPRWSFTDAAGHVHRWHEVGNPAPATSYTPTQAYHVPTLEHVDDEPLVVWDEYDGEDTIGQSHYECAQCREIIAPGRCPDDTPQYITGLVRWKDFTITINEPKSPDEVVPYMDAFLAGTAIPVAHPLGFSIKAFIRSINTHTTIGSDTPNRIDIVAVPTGAPMT